MINESIQELIKESQKPEEEQEYKGYPISYLRQVFNQVANKINWRDAWSAWVPYQIVNAVLVAVEFFHADRAQIEGSRLLDGFVLMSGNGYQAW